MKDLKRVVSPRLILTGLTRLRTPLLCLGILSLVLEAVPFLGGVFFWVDSWLDLSHVAPAAYLLPFAGPILFLCAFSFLFRRADTDFVQSLPYSRVCLFISFTLSVVTGLVLMTAGIGVCSLAYGLLHFDYFSPLTLLSVLGAALLSALMLTSFMALVVMLSGRALTALFMCPVFAVLPRMTLSHLFDSINHALDGTMNVAFMNFTRWEFFFPYGFLSMCSSSFPFLVYDYAVNSGSTAILSWTPESMIWSILATALLWAAALLLFLRRRSEWAGGPAAGRGALYAISAALSMIFAVPAAFAVSGSVIYSDGVIWVLLAAALLVWPVYMLVCTRSVRAVGRALPVFLSVLAVSAALAGTGAVLGAPPAAVAPENVKAVYISSLSPVRLSSASLIDVPLVKSLAVSDPSVISTAASHTGRTNESFKSYYAYFVMKDGRVLRAHLRIPNEGSHARELYDFESAYKASASGSLASTLFLDGLMTVTRYSVEGSSVYGSAFYIPPLARDAPARREIMERFRREFDPAHLTERQTDMIMTGYLTAYTGGYDVKREERLILYYLTFSDRRTGAMWKMIVSEDECPETFTCLEQREWRYTPVENLPDRTVIID